MSEMKVVIYTGNDKGYFKELVVGKQYFVIPSSSDYKYPPYYMLMASHQFTYPQKYFIDKPTTPTPSSQTHSAENNLNP